MGFRNQARKMAINAGHSQASNAKDKGMKAGKMVILRWLQTWMLPIRLVVRGIQLIFALTVIGLYGTKVHSDSDPGKSQDARWVIAVGVGSAAAIISVLFAIAAIPQFKTHRLFAVDFTIAILYIAIFGTFATIFLPIPEDDEHETHDGASVSTMRHAVWIDLVNALFWALTGGWGCFFTFAGKKVQEVADRGFDKATNKAYKSFGVDQPSAEDLEKGNQMNFDLKDLKELKLQGFQNSREMRNQAERLNIKVQVPTKLTLAKLRPERPERPEMAH
ncbi:hypothetical protein GGR57DRAFT_474029 [Xylariaceae sp. FL1272]|nr:hypothetical protein GGR57DRAFT_474029 [Xylariaceae sp. FL1272]